MTVLKDINGPDWPAGYIEVVMAGTPVRLTSLIDAGNINAPESPTVPGALEYTPRYQQLIFQGVHPGKMGGMTPNTRNVYIVRDHGDRDDYGTIVAVIAPGQTLIISAAPMVENKLSLYRYWVDGDHDNEGVLVTGLIF
jgi:hypothetical protein